MILITESNSIAGRMTPYRRCPRLKRLPSLDRVDGLADIAVDAINTADAKKASDDSYIFDEDLDDALRATSILRNIDTSIPGSGKGREWNDSLSSRTGKSSAKRARIITEDLTKEELKMKIYNLKALL